MLSRAERQLVQQLKQLQQYEQQQFMLNNQMPVQNTNIWGAAVLNGCQPAYIYNNSNNASPNNSVFQIYTNSGGSSSYTSPISASGYFTASDGMKYDVSPNLLTNNLSQITPQNVRLLNMAPNFMITNYVKKGNFNPEAVGEFAKGLKPEDLNGLQSGALNNIKPDKFAAALKGMSPEATKAFLDNASPEFLQEFSKHLTPKQMDKLKETIGEHSPDALSLLNEKLEVKPQVDGDVNTPPNREGIADVDDTTQTDVNLAGGDNIGDTGIPEDNVIPEKNC